MILTLLGICWLNLRRDWGALVLVFLLPLVFFSIFAVIFERLFNDVDHGDNGLTVLVVDEAETGASRRLIAALGRQATLKVEMFDKTTTAPADAALSQVDLARRAVRRGRYAAAVIVPAGWGESLTALVQQPKPIELIHDAANPLARPTVAGLLQAAAVISVCDAIAQNVQAWQDAAGIPRPLGRAIKLAAPRLVGVQRSSASGNAGTIGDFGLIRLGAQAARSEPAGDRPRGSMVAYYAAGIGVMFVLFSMSGAAAALLEEEETGTLERLLGAGVGMATLLVSKWIFYTFLAILQLTLMFVWGELIFGLGLWSTNRLAGFAAMTLFTSSAAASFGIMLATLCRTRPQLQGLSTMIIVIMSALGGSMVPRFLMPPFIKTTALFTLNGWALDGYLKVFWNDDTAASLTDSLTDLLPSVGMLTLSTFLFLTAARVLARRWETV